MSETSNTTESGRTRGGGSHFASLMRRASSLAEQGLYDEAIANIQKAMALCPHEPRCSLELANIYRAQNRIGPAIEAMRNAVELDPMDSTAHEQLLRTLLEIGRYDDAIKTSHWLLGRSPKNLFARDVLGIAYLQQGCLDEALDVCDEMIRLAPADAAHHFKKAVLLQQKGEIAHAMAEFVRALELDPEGEMADDTREAIAALDSFQLRQVLTIAVGDTVFRTKLILDPEPVLIERGFHLSSSGLLTLRQLDLDDLPKEPQSFYYH